MRSLGFRLTLAAGLVLAIFIGASAFALERAFRDSARSAREERLLAQVYLLMAAAEVDAQGRLTLAGDPAEPRLGLVGSGLYGFIVDGAGNTVWRSHSSVAAEAPRGPVLGAGTRRFDTVADDDGRDYFVQSFGVRWATARGAYPFTFTVAENLDAYERQLGIYRRSLLGWLGAMGLLLLAAQWLTLRWGLRPLRRVTDELTALESGRQSRIAGAYPTELQGLVSNLNTLLAHERTRQDRYRHALADLAHSLKTPLAVLKGAARGTDGRDAARADIDAQVERMDRIVGYHLRRAATAGRPAIGMAHDVSPLAARLVAVLRKVYADKPVDVEVIIDDALQFRGDDGDLTEALGNLLENAFKWCRARVRISAVEEGGVLRVTVEDDGPGIPEAHARQLAERGVRMDQSVPGHGLGLAVSRDIAESCGGSIAIARSKLGGAMVTLQFTTDPSR